MKLPKKTLDRITQIKERLYFNKPAEEKLSFRDFANKVFNKEVGFYDLAEFQVEMAEWRLNNLTGVSLLLATRGIGKTDIITCLTSLYLIYKDPTISVLLVSRKASNVNDIMTLAIKIITRSPDFFIDYDVKNLLKGSLRTKQNQGKESSLYTGTCGGDLRGRGHPDYIVFDDVLSFTSSKSSTNRELAYAQFNEATSLMKKGLLLVGNVCHQLDLYTTLRGTGIPKFEIFHGDERIPEHLRPDLDFSRSQGKSEAQIQADYFGILLPDESSPFYDLNIVYANQLPKVSNINLDCFYDFSNGGKDYNAVSIGFVFNYELYIIGFAMQGMWSEFIGVVNQKIIQLQINNAIKNIYYESNTGGYEPREKFNQMGYKSVLPKHTSENKRFKISKLYGKFKSIKFISLDNDLHNKKYIELVKNYSPKDNNTIDDAVDSLAMLCLANNWIQ